MMEAIAQVETGIVLGRHADCGMILLMDYGDLGGLGVCQRCGKRWHVRLHVELVAEDAGRT